MNELYNQNSPHQYPEDIQNLDGNPAEELSITASLNAIDGMGYSDHNYLTVGTPPSTFSLRRCPGQGLFGISGDRCFLLTSSELREIMPWEGDGLAMLPFFQIPDGFVNLEALFSDVLLSDAEKLTIFAGWLVGNGVTADRAYQGVEASYMEFLGYVPEPFASQIPANGSNVLTEHKQIFDQYFAKAYDYFKDRGLEISLQDSLGAPKAVTSIFPHFSDYAGETVTEFVIGVQFSAQADSFNTEIIAYQNWKSSRS